MALGRARGGQRDFRGAAGGDDRIRQAVAGVGVEDQAQLSVVTRRQRTLAGRLEHAVGQVEQVDLPGRRQREVVPARIGVGRRGTLVHAHRVDGHVDRVEVAGRGVGHRDAEHAHGGGGRRRGRAMRGVVTV